MHVPVLLKEAIDFLNVRRGGTYIDATVGLGGHSFEIARRLGAPGHLIGFDKDPKALEIAEGVLGRWSSVVGQEPTAHSDAMRPGDWPSVELRQGSFAELAKDQRLTANDAVDGILADLGVSSLQLDNAARGFSFQAEGPLDMRMDPHNERTAEQVVNHLDERELADVIYEFGEERRSRRIARAIVRSRPIRSTAHLAQVISAAARPMNRGRDEYERRIHPATRTFQALRIFVNRELDDLRALLDAAPRVLKPGGRVVIISFHSLEDRLVKDAFRAGEKEFMYYRVLTRKPVVASDLESDRNPRARSAKLRAAERL
ncbi:MAG TPA: 16S rRNA (cytosine(1402)-N(4))-methyltransferase RsmH [Candidatus Binatia bacterium]|nr:16S rRNA (cytosine(1402)-N(4))-methyltransferase RsmH [Candidatus Binatia bacterium]